MEYWIVSATSPRKLVDEVKKFLQDGWEPQGGPAYAKSGGPYLDGHLDDQWHQALIRKRKNT